MENLLLMGIDTRPMVNSALKLDYKTFSISYFKTVDFKMPYMEKHVLDQESVISCGRFEENYSPDKLLELSKDFLFQNDRENEIDKIVLTTGINAKNFSGEFKKFRKISYGNKNTECVENKFKFYNKLKNKFNVPLTFQPSDVGELNEILQQYANNQFILKPLQGSGGLGIFLLNNDILQEHIEGTNVSSSVLSSHNDRKNLINSRLITEHDLGNESYEYSGNILPLDENSFRMFNDNQTNSDDGNTKNINFNELNDEMKNTSEDLIRQFKLIGSNGVDYILDKDGELKVIEINPRFQGTYELVENVLGINLLDAHINACEGEIIDIPNPSKYSIKKIIYARKQVNIGNLNIPNVYDIPYEGVKIEKDQPLVTIISSNEDLKTAIDDAKIAEDEVYKNIG